MKSREEEVRAAFDSAIKMVEIFMAFNHAGEKPEHREFLAQAVEGGIMFAFETALQVGGWHQDEQFQEWAIDATSGDLLREGLRRTLAHMSEEG